MIRLRVGLDVAEFQLFWTLCYWHLNVSLPSRCPEAEERNVHLTTGKGAAFVFVRMKEKRNYTLM